MFKETDFELRQCASPSRIRASSPQILRQAQDDMDICKGLERGRPDA